MNTQLKDYGLLQGDLVAIARAAGVTTTTVRRVLLAGPHVSDRTHAKVVGATKNVRTNREQTARVARERKAQQRTIILAQLSNK